MNIRYSTIMLGSDHARKMHHQFGPYVGFDRLLSKHKIGIALNRKLLWERNIVTYQKGNHAKVSVTYKSFITF